MQVQYFITSKEYLNSFPSNASRAKDLGITFLNWKFIETPNSSLDKFVLSPPEFLPIEEDIVDYQSNSNEIDVLATQSPKLIENEKLTIEQIQKIPVSTIDDSKSSEQLLRDILQVYFPL